MEVKLNPYSLKSAAFWLICLAVLRLYYLSDYSYTLPLLLSFDEAQYWWWAKYPAFGYYSKPPMIAWLLSTVTGFCGDSVFCIKSPAVLMHTFIAFAIYLLTKRIMGNEKPAFWASMMYVTLPGVTISSAYISTDVPLMLCWALGLYFTHKALDDNPFAERYWFLSGVMIGLGMLSKYTMLFFPLSLIIYLLVTRHRVELIRAPFWVAMGIALILFSPNIYWNALSNFVSFSHTNDNVFSQETSVYFLEMLAFIGGQLMLFGPIFWLALVIGLRHTHNKWEKDDHRLLILFAVPLLLVAILVSLLSSAQAHWAAPAYISLAIYATILCVDAGKMRILQAALGFNLLFALAFWHYPGLVIRFDLPNPFERIYRWNALANVASTHLNRYPSALLVFDERKAIGPVSYQLRLQNGRPYPVHKWNADGEINDHFDMISRLPDHIGRDFIFISRTEDGSGLGEYFATIQPLEQTELYGNSFTVLLGKDFQGYGLPDEVTVPRLSPVQSVP